VVPCWNKTILGRSTDGDGSGLKFFKIILFSHGTTALNHLFTVMIVVFVCLHRIAERTRHARQLVECVASDAVKVCTSVSYLLLLLCPSKYCDEHFSRKTAQISQNQHVQTSRNFLYVLSGAQSSLMTVAYFMYFRFCGWCCVFL